MSDSWKMHPVTQLFLARYREFIRQPEAVFWSYVFPLVMMISLGLAFRSEPMEAISIAVQESPGADALMSRLQADPRLILSLASEEECRSQLRAGKCELIVVPLSGSPLTASTNTASELTNRFNMFLTRLVP